MTHSPDKLTNVAIIIVITLLFSINVAKAENVAPSTFFLRPLKVGMSGEDVRELQKILNSRPDTAVRGVGIGSKGQETTYFGSLTRDAVVRFQETYRDIVLVPNGLSSGTGYVGPATLAVLNSISPATSQEPRVAIEQAPLSNIQQKVSDNPNEENLDIFLKTVDRIARTQGTSEETIAHIKSNITQSIATSTDLTKEFIDIVQKSISTVPQPIKNKLTDAIKHVISAIFPKPASAQVASDFGGRLLFAFKCDCSQTWLITISPLPPTYVVLLDYVPMTQMYLSYNIPKTTQLLGKYTKPKVGMCFVSADECTVPIPSEGLITPAVGSALR